MPIKIFLSHSAADEPLASALVAVSCQAWCYQTTSCVAPRSGHKLPVGSDFAATLLEDIGDSSVVMSLCHSKLDLGPYWLQPVWAPKL